MNPLDRTMILTWPASSDALRVTLPDAPVERQLPLTLTQNRCKSAFSGDGFRRRDGRRQKAYSPKHANAWGWHRLFLTVHPEFCPAFPTGTAKDRAEAKYGGPFCEMTSWRQF